MQRGLIGDQEFTVTCNIGCEGQMTSIEKEKTPGLLAKSGEVEAEPSSVIRTNSSG